MSKYASVRWQYTPQVIKCLVDNIVPRVVPALVINWTGVIYNGNHPVRVSESQAVFQVLELFLILPFAANLGNFIIIFFKTKLCKNSLSFSCVVSRTVRCAVKWLKFPNQALYKLVYYEKLGRLKAFLATNFCLKFVCPQVCRQINAEQPFTQAATKRRIIFQNFKWLKSLGIFPTLKFSFQKYY